MRTSNEDRRGGLADQPFYRDEVAPILPPAILDFHTHTWSADSWKATPWAEDKPGVKYMVTTEQYPPRDLIADGRRCFPDRSYEAVCFGYPTPAADWEKDTRFVAAAGRCRGLYPLAVAGPALGVSREGYATALDAGNFLGFKVFLNWFGDDYGDLRVEDMFGPAEIGLANERKLVVLLHVPRRGRLADKAVQAGVDWLAKTCPEARIVLAHCGRCYLPAEMKRAVGAVRPLQNVYMDTSMVMDPLVLRMAMEAVGSERLVFGTDFPVAAMRGRRVRVMDHWVDVVLGDCPASDYRVRADNIRATFMALEIAVAIRDAAESLKLPPAQLRAIFFDNGMRLLERVMDGEQIRRVRGAWR